MFMLKATIIAASLSMGTYAVACPNSKKQEKQAEVASVSVDAAAKLLKLGKIIMVDANTKDVRKELGVVPGARLLTSYNNFAASELKATKADTLVFYCYNESCSAAPSAARTAKAKGFKIKVMDGGIIGWKKAGHKVQTI